MAPYQKPTVEDVEDEIRKNQEHGFRGQAPGMGNQTWATATVLTAAVETKRLRKRKCAWEGAQRPFIPNVCR